MSSSLQRETTMRSKRKSDSRTGSKKNHVWITAASLFLFVLLPWYHVIQSQTLTLTSKTIISFDSVPAVPRFINVNVSETTDQPITMISSTTQRQTQATTQAQATTTNNTLSTTTRKPEAFPTKTKTKTTTSINTSNASIVMGGLFLNNGIQETIQMYKLMSQTVSYFQRHTLILLENDSTDGTTATLQNICDENTDTVCINLRGYKRNLNRFQTTDIKLKRKENPAFAQERFSRMSWYRNMLLQQVTTQMRNVDYFVVCDPDLFQEAWFPTKKIIDSEYSKKMGAMTPPNFGGTGGRAWNASSVLESIHHANTHHPDWTAVCFYGTFGEESTMYDMLAFRLSEQTPIPDLAKKYQPEWTRDDWNLHLSAPAILQKKAKDTELHMAMFVFGYSQQQQQQQQREFIPVRSCFGGLAIYKVSKLQESGCIYDKEARDCEHVTLNECLFDKFPDSIFVDPASRVYYDSVAPTVHTMDGTHTKQ